MCKFSCSQEQDAEPPAMTRRSRAITDPKAHVLVSQSSSASVGEQERGATNDQPPRKLETLQSSMLIVYVLFIVQYATGKIYQEPSR